MIPLLLAITHVLWASAFVGIRFALRTYDPCELAALRFCVASAVLLIVGRAGDPQIDGGCCLRTRTGTSRAILG